MLESLIQGLRRRGLKSCLCSTDERETWRGMIGADEFVELLPLRFCQVASGIRRDFICRLNFLSKLWRCRFVFVVGADVMDGFYSDFASERQFEYVALALLAGARVTITGFSINENPRPDACRSFTRVGKQVCWSARDAISQARLERIVGRPVPLSADVAFLLEPGELTDTDSILVRPILEARQSGRTVVALNLHLKLISKTLSEADLVAFGAHLIEFWATRIPDLLVVLVVHDFREHEGERRILDQILKGLSGGTAKCCRLLDEPMPAAQFRRVCGLFDFAVVGKMHFAIGCLAMGVPAVSLGYQGKFEGLYRYFNLEELAIPVQRTREDQSLLDEIGSLFDRRRELSEKIRELLPEVKAKAAVNFAMLDP